MEDKSYELLKPNENDFGYLLWRIMRLWQRERQKRLDEYGTTTSQLELLGSVLHLNSQKEEVTQILLSQEANIDPMTTSTILRNLEKRGLVIRKPSQTDTRARVVHITEAGEELFFTAIHKLKEVQQLLLQEINDKVLVTELKKLLSGLEKISINDK